MSDDRAAVSARGGALVVRGARSVKLLTEPVLFEEEALPGFVRLALFTVCCLVVAFLVWASMVHIDEVAVATGQVLPAGDIQLVQHLEGGTVSEILVHDAQRVKKGQVLVKLDPTQPLADLRQAQGHLVDLELRAERLHAEVEGRAPDFSTIATGYPELEADERRIWASRVAANRSAVEVVDTQIAQRQAELSQLGGQLSIAQQQLQLTTDQVNIRDQGVQAGVVAREVYIETKRAQVTAEGEVDRIRQQIDVDRGAVAEAEERKRNLAQTQVQDALGELGTVNDEMAQVKDGVAKLQDRVDRLDIRAPADGLVQDLRVHTVGEVIPAGFQVASVVPVGETLVAQVRISPSDIGHVRAGQPVKVKVASFEYTRYGMLAGTVTRLSPSTLTDEQGHPYYRGEVSIPQPYMGDNPDLNRLLPGMSVETDITTGDKTLMQYLLKPVFVSLSDSFHEP